MAASNSDKVLPEIGNPGPMTRTAADDMAEIFGHGVRTSRAAASGRFVEASVGSPRRFVAAAAIGLVAATLAVGVFAGNIKTAVPDAAPSTRGGHREPHAEIYGQTVSPATLTAPARATARLAPSGRTGDTPALSYDRTAVLAAQAPPMKPIVRPRALASPVTAIPDTLRPRPSLDQTLASRPAPVQQRSGCDEYDDACFASRVDLAEQRLGLAFTRAAAAGVRARTLRGYQREWDRAREEALDHPREALRLYAMVTADLDHLADDRAIRAGAVDR